jgi:hypothetical protein
LDIYNEEPVLKYERGKESVHRIDSFYLFNEYIIETSNGTIYISKKDSLLKNIFSKYTARHKIISVCAINKFILALDFGYEVSYYSHELKYLKKIGQKEDETKPFYFNKVKQIDIRDDTLYLRRDDSIDIMNESTGIVTISIKILKCYKFIIDDKMEQLIAFNGDGIFRFDLKSGKSISNINTSNSIPKDYKFLEYKDGRYLLKSRNNKELYQITF